MILNNETAERIVNLLRIGKYYNTCTYVGCWTVDTVDFVLSCEIDGERKAGIVVTLNDDFKLLKVKRIRHGGEWIGLKYIGSRDIYLPIIPA